MISLRRIFTSRANLVRFYSVSAPSKKRFYKEASIVKSNDSYEIILDQRKLKTPAGSVLLIPNRLLALAVANEWNMQKDTIITSAMHFTGLCNTAQDNPGNHSVDSLCTSLLEYLVTDTLLFQSSEPEDLAKLQQLNWNPVIQWFCNHFEVDVGPTNSLDQAHIPSKSKDIIARNLLSQNRWSLLGLLHCTESLKSLILSMALCHNKLSVDGAVYLGKLESEYQIEKWGRVAFAHDLDSYDLQARVAAASIFHYLCCHEEQNVNVVR